MARMFTFLVCANLLICTLAAVKSSSSTTTSHTLSPTPTPTTPPVTHPTTHPTTHPGTTEPVTESPALEKNNTFILYDEKNVVCLMMEANMTVVYTYKSASNPNKTVSQSDPMDGLATIVPDTSKCNANNAMLTLRWDAKSGEGADPRFITFNFSANYRNSHMHWTFDKIALHVVFSSVDFPDYNISSRDILYNSTGFFNDTVEFERGYQCLASQEHQLKSLTNHQIAASITVTDFHIQAFDFKKAGEFGNVRKCLADSGDGKKIVPIAVGIALAVLIIVVIIAFIISKLVNRKKNSYEPLN